MKKIFLSFFIILFLFTTGQVLVLGEKQTQEKYGLSIDTQQNQFDNKLEIILFENLVNPVENLAKKLTGADVVTSDSIEYTLMLSNNEKRSLKLKIMRYSFLRLEYSIFFH